MSTALARPTPSSCRRCESWRTALLEEPADDLDDAALAQFIEDAATLESKYTQMLAKFQQDHTTVVRYGTAADADFAAIEASFADFGLKILGPIDPSRFLPR